MIPNILLLVMKNHRMPTVAKTHNKRQEKHFTEILIFLKGLVFLYAILKCNPLTFFGEKC